MAWCLEDEKYREFGLEVKDKKTWDYELIQTL